MTSPQLSDTTAAGASSSLSAAWFDVDAAPVIFNIHRRCVALASSIGAATRLAASSTRRSSETATAILVEQLHSSESDVSNFRRELFDLFFQLIPKKQQQQKQEDSSISSSSSLQQLRPAVVDFAPRRVCEAISFIFNQTEAFQHVVSQCLDNLRRTCSSSFGGGASSAAQRRPREMTTVAEGLSPQQNRLLRDSNTNKNEKQPIHIEQQQQQDDDDDDKKHRQNNNNNQIPDDWLTPADRISVRWSDIIGADAAVEALQQAVTLPLRFPELFLRPCGGGMNQQQPDDGAAAAAAPPPPSPRSQQHQQQQQDDFSNIPWKALCMWGPPGTGKSTLASATAAEAGASFIAVTAADLLSKYVGESEKSVRLLFSAATRVRGRCIVFLDEIDALCAARGSTGETEAARRVKTEFLVRVQRLPPHVLVLAATNTPWELDPAFCRRFDQFIYVGLPGEGARFQILCRQLSCSRRGEGSATKTQDSLSLLPETLTTTTTKSSSSKTVTKKKKNSKSQEENGDDDDDDDDEKKNKITTVEDDEDHNIKDSKKRMTAAALTGCTLTLPVDAQLTIADVFEAAQHLDGYSGSDLGAIAKHTLMGPVRRMQRATHFRFDNALNKFVVCVADAAAMESAKTTTMSSNNNKKNTSSRMTRNNSSSSNRGTEMSLFDIAPGQVVPLPLTKEDLEAARVLYRRTCTEQELARYESWSGDGS